MLASLVRHGHDVVAADDRPGDAARAAAGNGGVELVEAPDAGALLRLLDGAEEVLLDVG